MLIRILKNSGLIFIIWTLVMAVYTFTSGVRDFDYIWRFILWPGLVLAGIIGLSTLLQDTVPTKRRIFWPMVLLFLGLDQAIKIYLFSLEWEVLSIPLIEPVFYLEPTQNTLGSYLWVLLRLDHVPKLANILLFTVVGFLFFEIWRFYTARKRTSIWINGYIVLFISGLSANIIDNAVWGGSLDYITIKPFYTFDLKDMYITLCELFLVTELLENRLLRRLFTMPSAESKRVNRAFMDQVKSDLGRLNFLRKRSNPEE